MLFFMLFAGVCCFWYIYVDFHKAIISVEFFFSSAGEFDSNEIRSICTII